MVLFSFLSAYVDNSLVSADLICYQSCGMSGERAKAETLGKSASQPTRLRN